MFQTADSVIGIALDYSAEFSKQLMCYLLLAKLG